MTGAINCTQVGDVDGTSMPDHRKHGDARGEQTDEGEGSGDRNRAWQALWLDAGEQHQGGHEDKAQVEVLATLGSGWRGGR